LLDLFDTTTKDIIPSKLEGWKNNDPIDLDLSISDLTTLLSATSLKDGTTPSTQQRSFLYEQCVEYITKLLETTITTFTNHEGELLEDSEELSYTIKATTRDVESDWGFLKKKLEAKPHQQDRKTHSH
jgi:hypothetical protein